MASNSEMTVERILNAALNLGCNCLECRSVRAAHARGMEEAAKIVDGRIANWMVGTGTCRPSLLAECEDIAAAIRSRIKELANG